MDPVLADPAADHDDGVSGLGALDRGIAPVRQFARHKADGASENQRLAPITVVEEQETLRGGNAGLIAAVFDALDHAVDQPACGRQRRGRRPVAVQHRGIIGVGQAKAIAVEDRSGALPEAQTIAVDPHNPGHGTAVGVERAG